MSIDQPQPATPEAARATRHAGRRRRQRGPVSGSFAWAFAPLYTVGLGAWAVFLYAAIRCRSAWLGGASALYAVLFAVFVVAETPAKPGPVASSIGAVAWLACGLGGTAHALAIRRRVFFPVADPKAQALERAEAEVLERRKLRERARGLVARDPQMARELGIGRPDLRREYDDGGLVDVNHAPASALVTLPGMTAGLAAKAVALREERGAYVSADDLCNALSMSPDTVPDLADRTLYLS
jgi:DNA uptake protein ComE-like DNA-binding protein